MTELKLLSAGLTAAAMLATLLARKHRLDARHFAKNVSAMATPAVVHKHVRDYIN